ncbi:MAG: glycosyltransferase family 4 protein [Phycisphaerae bacterium]|nr:glycosyltransferase family 4 protein [Phycisphaerae bacterium]
MLPDLRRRVRQADVVWAVLPGVYPVLGWWFRQDRQLRITQQGGDPSQSIQLVYPRLGFVGGYLDKCCHKLAEQADIASYVSDKLRARYGGEARRTLVFNNSRLTSEMLWDRKGTAMHKPFRLLYIGRLSPEKGLFFLLEALRDLEDIELRVVGIGHAEEELKRLAAELGVDQKVTWLGRLQWGPELFSALREGDASILPSLTEGLPLALVDAMSQSLPVIGSNVGGIPEVIEDGLNGILIPPGSSKAIVEAVNRMRSKKLWTTLHRGAFETAKNHTIEKQLGKLLVMIRQWWESRRVM